MKRLKHLNLAIEALRVADGDQREAAAGIRAKWKHHPSFMKAVLDDLPEAFNMRGVRAPTQLLKAVGAGKTRYSFNKPNGRILEVFESPMIQMPFCESWVRIEAPEFTSLCPKTGQPDFATIIVEYRPGELCIESKSFKLYLMGFRQHGEFHESCVQRIADDLVRALRPIELKVEGRFTPRGGIPFWPRVHYRRPQGIAR